MKKTVFIRAHFVLNQPLTIKRTEYNTWYTRKIFNGVWGGGRSEWRVLCSVRAGHEAKLRSKRRNICMISYAWVAIMLPLKNQFYQENTVYCGETAQPHSVGQVSCCQVAPPIHACPYHRSISPPPHTAHRTSALASDRELLIRARRASLRAATIGA